MFDVNFLFGENQKKKILNFVRQLLVTVHEMMLFILFVKELFNMNLIVVQHVRVD